MFIIKGKRLLIIMSCLVLSFLFANVKNENEKETIETVALPVENKVIILDARSWLTR